MIGYIYLTTNSINDMLYIGKHKCDHYDKSYHGSGNAIKDLTDKYGKGIFTTVILCEAQTMEELNKLEKEYISEFRERYPNKIYNIAEGGDGGNVQLGYTSEQKQEFINKMTNINRKRCQSDEFRKNKSKYMRNKYLDQSERDKQSKIVKKAWSDPKLKKEQSERLKAYFNEHPKDQSYLYKKCYIIIDGIRYDFICQKDMLKFLKDKYNYEPGRGKNGSLSKIMNSEKTGIPFIPRNKKGLENGIIASYIDESVQTMGDECNPVGFEISTNPKCVAKPIELVQFYPIDLVQWS